MKFGEIYHMCTVVHFLKKILTKVHCITKLAQYLVSYNLFQL